MGVVLISKKPRVITLIDSQHVKWSETLHESPRQNFSHIFWSLWKEISSKYSVLVVSVILTLFFNIFSTENKYSVSKNEWLRQRIRMQLSPNQKIFSEFFFFISGIYIKFEILWKKTWASEVICFWNYRLQKAGLLKWLKSPVSAHLWTVNMLKWAKKCLDLHGNIFVIFFDHSERKSAPKNIFS